MQQNILKSSNVTKIFLSYVDGKKNSRKEKVTLRYTDEKSCYFVGDSLINFAKPKWRAKADIIAYTPNGIYTATVIIRDASYSLNNIFYKVDIPKTWKFTQLRKGTRKYVSLPLTLKFNDGVEISGETYDLSVGGFSFNSLHDLTTVQKRFACNCKIKFPQEGIINFPDGELEVDAMFVRQKPILDDYELRDHRRISFKFINLSSDYELILKNFLMKVE